jgi:hypothetical protein
LEYLTTGSDNNQIVPNCLSYSILWKMEHIFISWLTFTRIHHRVYLIINIVRNDLPIINFGFSMTYCPSFTNTKGKNKPKFIFFRFHIDFILQNYATKTFLKLYL